MTGIRHFHGFLKVKEYIKPGRHLYRYKPRYNTYQFCGCHFSNLMTAVSIWNSCNDFSELNVTIIQLCQNLCHQLFPNRAVNAFGFLQDIPPRKLAFSKNLHITGSQASFFLLCLLFSVSLAGGTPLASTQAPAQWGEQQCLIYNQAAASIASCSQHTAMAPWPSRSPRESATTRQRQRQRKPATVHASTS